MDFVLEHPALFVTGTDTDVGKTVATAAIALWLRGLGQEVCAVKPLATGCRLQRGKWQCDDARLLSAASSPHGNAVMAEAGCEPGRALVAWKHPLAPSCAARLEQRPLYRRALHASLTRLGKACGRAGVRLLIEGVGGPLVPLTTRTTVADWIVQLELPAILVTRTELGTINHTLMAAECLASRGVPLVGIIASRRRSGRLALVERESLGEITRLLPRVPVAVLEYLEPPTTT
jgi:dethiobiotin synthetase